MSDAMPRTALPAAGNVLITGVTGFLGQAVLERIISSMPDLRVTVLIRLKGTLTGRTRLNQLLRKPVFGNWVARVGGRDAAEQVLAERVSVLEGDLLSVPKLPADLTAVVHSASTVSFDPPIDEAFSTNLGGAESLYRALAASGGAPHVIHVSTAYVGGLRKGVVGEESLRHTSDWRREAEAAREARGLVEASSRRPEILKQAIAKARSRHGKAGPQAISSAAEANRIDWVNKRLIEYGRTRAQSLGWPDVYAFTKALGERVAEELWAEQGNRLSVLRPSIVESALRHPFPGWIDGFKVADPLILAYGRGVLPEFPGLPDSVLDIIPVDFVVNAILALVEQPSEQDGARYFHLASGASNPFLFREMYENVHSYFRSNPVPDGDGAHIQVPTWNFPGRHRIESKLRTSERTNAIAERMLTSLPGTVRTRKWMQGVMVQQNDLEILRHYADLYQPYTQAEIIYDDANTRALHQSLSDGAKTERGFDVREIDWTTYFQQIHFPGITKSMRAFSSRPASVPAGDVVLKRAPDTLAIFDLEGTVVSSNTVEHYLWIQLAMRSRLGWLGDVADLARSAPGYLRAEERDRGEFIRTFMRRYKGLDVEKLRKLMSGEIGDLLMSRVRPDALRRIDEHREAGHRTVLVTGTIDAIVTPLEPFFDEVVAGRMHEADGRWTGYLATPPLVDEARAAWLERYARECGADLARSYAYGDSHADLSWLQLVGNPHVVNPDPGLYRHAVQARWKVEEWAQRPLTRLDSLRSGFQIRADRH
ncbi:HAD-IB family hydrolase [Saxibacter everestensis]|uniref:HAD-IB family hydrolase n=1 Tax=Saxibacter everestensis TaxID=2909229 RepID=A0ABY8QX98_9MICO|nr:HAD-IB family hydrolase [Brevibacteriaceae bacterium ZFBP1038]